MPMNSRPIGIELIRMANMCDQIISCNVHIGQTIHNTISNVLVEPALFTCLKIEHAIMLSWKDVYMVLSRIQFFFYTGNDNNCQYHMLESTVANYMSIVYCIKYEIVTSYCSIHWNFNDIGIIFLLSNLTFSYDSAFLESMPTHYP